MMIVCVLSGNALTFVAGFGLLGIGYIKQHLGVST
jgi:hypothetical protein